MPTATAVPRHRALPYSVRCILFLFLVVLPWGRAEAAFTPDRDYLQDRRALEELQRESFAYAWEEACEVSGMVYESQFDDWAVKPVAVGGTGFGVAAIVVAADRGWIPREQAVGRILKILTFIRDCTLRHDYHGALPHWLDGTTGQAISFGLRDDGADLVETSLLLQGLLLARAYFNGPGIEEKLRRLVTEIWEDVEWDWFTGDEDDGLYWHWDKEHGFHHGLKILGYNECLITYVLAISSPTHPISRSAYDYWTSGINYLPREVFGYRLQATHEGGGPLFLAQYSFIGLDPRRIRDDFVTDGYFVRNVTQTLANRGYCLQSAPAENGYGEGFWGLTASNVPDGYNANDPLSDTGTVAPTAALSSMPYTPHYSLQVLQHLRGPLRKKAWGPYGPRDGINLRDDWASDRYIAIDQLPIVSMVENYRSGLLWRLFMAIPEIRTGLAAAGLTAPDFDNGFPEAVVTLVRANGGYAPDAHDLRRHPDDGQYAVPYWTRDGGPAVLELVDSDGTVVRRWEVEARAGRNVLRFPQFMPTDAGVMEMVLRLDEDEHRLPVRLH
ncbi:MAG: beta-glucosidase [Planctomycetes bacterium]|nr:beta-glucosidase [Planctomycetota bacterium]